MTWHSLTIQTHFLQLGSVCNILLAEISKKGFLRRSKKERTSSRWSCVYVLFWVGKRTERNLRGPLQLKSVPHIRVHFYSSPSLGKVGPVSHDYSAQHHIVFGEVTVEQISGSHHGHTEHIGHLHTHRKTL